MRPRRHSAGPALTTIVLLLAGMLAAVLPTAAPARATPSCDTHCTNAYSFLDSMMDLYQTGTATRMMQSYVSGQPGNPNLYREAFTYDDALAVLAFVARGTPDDIARASAIANAFLFAQANDPSPGDVPACVGAQACIRDGYQAWLGGWSSWQVSVYSPGITTGNMAWAGIALMQLYNVTHNAAYLQGAQRIGTFINTNLRNPGAHQGFYFGWDPNSEYTLVPAQATEHNIDLYSLYHLLYAATGDSSWLGPENWALTFIQYTFQSSGSSLPPISCSGPGQQASFTMPFFWTGVVNPTPQQPSIQPYQMNTCPIPEDVQTWSYLALGMPAYAGSVTTVQGNLGAIWAGNSGVSFSSWDRSGVWFEGTGHLADALFARDGPNSAAGNTYLATLETAQTGAPNADGMSIVAASTYGLQTGFGFNYYPMPHIGATSWYLMAKTRFNPMGSPPPAASITASPTTVVAPSTSTLITFSTGDGSTGQVYVSMDGGSEVLVTQGSSGSFTAPWISTGHSYVFRLYAGTSHTTVLSSVTVTTSGSVAPFVTASPATVIAPSTTTSISYSTGDSSIGQVYVTLDGGSEVLVAQSASGMVNIPWIQPGHTYLFKLYAGTAHTTLLASAPVTGQGSTAFISANPTSVPTSGGSGSTSITFSTGNGSTGQVYVSMNGGSDVLVVQGSDYTFTAPWIQHSTSYVFKLYAGTGHTTILGQVTVTGQ